MKNRWIILGAAVTLSAPFAWAGLGQVDLTPSIRTAGPSVATTSARIVARSMPDSLQIRAAKGPNGMPVQEYIAADGSLFAITWAGPRHVQAQDLVRQFFPHAAASSDHAAHEMQAVVRSARQPWGNEGVAYLPALMPMDFDPNTLAP
ncbi:DUF2844 domain-containing protein [Thiomonas bhubaneswarensis]|uniref:DUF2844 domain-containing protein n=1 Tax=Thiomonas bhubaneswarensis TaxID=339866 RepID=A0A0K6I5F6_9BURK|nr:DUF2844 domain-containing protein [Thiomonas bhubaneswarensis]CUA98278.1 Protein of unknown function (DUF2844) [Thiomonas bhubaneswarensis]